MMQKLFTMLCIFFSTNAIAVNPTQGPLQQDPSLCQYGYNPNCHSNNNNPPKKIIQHVHIDVPSKFGALALNSKTGNIAGALNAQSKVEAEKEAIKRCENGKNHGSCRVIVWVRNGCVAAVQGKSGKSWKLYKAAEKPGQAESVAMNRCKASGATECKILMPEGCSVPDGMYN